MCGNNSVTLYVLGIALMMNEPTVEIWKLNEPLSPPIESMVFRMVTDWPGCSDMRPQVWRLISNHLLHGEFSCFFYICTTSSLSYCITDGVDHPLYRNRYL
jgi:hypothetical protein